MGEELRGLITSTGEVIRTADHQRGMPTKVAGQHRWIATTSHYLSSEQAEAAHIDGDRVLMDGSNLLAVGIGCWDCEQEWVTCHGQPCPAGDQW